PALALGGSTPAPKPSAASCAKNKTKSSCRAKAACYWSNSRKRCRVRKRRSQNDADEKIYQQARALIEAKNYRDGLRLLLTIKEQNRPHVLNYIGFSTRKLGDVDKGISYYHKALALDPDYVVAREYLGEGYLQKGDLAGAEKQLGEISSRDCRAGCEAYDDLAEAIADYKAGKLPKNKP
ncbi:MAG: tetratricopeptide repeat protein, partial [Hyphomicrobiaceae bacterium]